MPEQYYNPLSDLGKIKESLIALFYNTEDLTRLVPHCFDTPYIEGMTMGHDSAIFVETYLTKAVSQRIKEVGIDIWKATRNITSQKESMEIESIVPSR